MSEDTVTGSPIHIIESDTIRARYLKLPITDLSYRFLVEITQPIPLVLTEKQITYSAKNHEAALKALLLEEWKMMIAESGLDKFLEWVNKVDKVELVECELTEKK